MENELLDPPETFEPADPEIFPSGVVIQSGADGYEMLLFGGTVSAEEAIENGLPTVIGQHPRWVLEGAFDWVSGWYVHALNAEPPAAVFPFTPPTTFVGFYSEDHPDVR